MPIYNTVKLRAFGMETANNFFALKHCKQRSPVKKSSHWFFIKERILINMCLILLLTTIHSEVAYTAIKDNSMDLKATSSSNAKRAIPSPLYGITLDAIDPLEKIIDSISSLSKKMTTRVVFDEWVPAKEYTEALDALYPKSYIMGEILDSFYVKDYSVKQYSARVKEYLDAHGDKVDIWEIGNEVNGEWLGNPDNVVTKIEDAYQQVKSRNYKSALTLYYNKDCWAHSWEEMFQWAKRRLSNNLRTGLDYLLVSYYEEDCNNLKPDWQSVFNKLGKLFPNAKLAFGEVGTSKSRKKSAYLKRYYTMKIDHPHYVGGHFWWYYLQDMVPKTKPLWSTLNTVLKDIDKSHCDAGTQSLPNNDWRLISLPCQPPAHANTVTKVFGKNSSGDYGNGWLVYRYDSELKDYIALEAGDTVDQGIGYWMIQVSGKTVSLDMPTDSVSTPVVQSDGCSTTQGCFEIPLATQSSSAQWNLVGNPFSGSHTLDTLRIASTDPATSTRCTSANSCTLKEAEANGFVHHTLWHYVDNKMGYTALEEGDATQPWDGFWTATMEKADGNKPRLLMPLDNHAK